MKASEKKAGKTVGEAEENAAALASGEEETKRKRTSGQRRNTKSSSPKDEASELQKIWSRKMALDGLKRIFAAALEGARTEVLDEDGALVEVKFNPSAANAATKAIEVANRMLGYTAPEAEDAEAAAVIVDLGDAAEFAE